MRKMLLATLLALLSFVMLSGCGGDSGLFKTVGYAPLESPGYYADVLMTPNGEFWVRGKVDEAKAAESGLVFKADFNDKKKLEKITAMVGSSRVMAIWRDTLGNKYVFSVVTREAQEGFLKYNFKNAQLETDTGYYGACAIRWKLDEKEKRPKMAYLYDAEGEQKNNLDGFSQLLFTYDDKGTLAKVGFADLNGERVSTLEKFYELHLKFAEDEKNPLPTEVANYGKDGSLMNDSKGIARTTYQFDDQMRRIEARHFGADDALKIKKGDFWGETANTRFFSAGAITKYSYDGDDYRPRSMSFYGKDEQPFGLAETGNAATYEFTYTNLGLASVKALATDGNPAAVSTEAFGNNVSEVVTARNEKGEVFQESYKGKEGNPVVSEKKKCASMHFKYDEHGKLTEIAIFGTSDEPIEGAFGLIKVHRIVTEYDDEGEAKLDIFYDKHGKEVWREKAQ